MVQWARRELHEQDGGIGYPSKAAFLIIHSSNPARTDPTGECARDFRELDAALEDCRVKRPEQWTALMLYYKPWQIARARAEGHPFGNSTYFYRLHAAHKSVSEFILTGCHGLSDK